MRKFLFISAIFFAFSSSFISPLSGFPVLSSYDENIKPEKTPLISFRDYFYSSPTLALVDTVGYFQATFVNDTVSAALITIKNTGTSSGDITGVTSSNSTFSITYPSFPQIVDQDSSVTFIVKFSPKVTGDISGTLTFATTDTANSSLVFTINGIGSLPNAGTLTFVEFKKDGVGGVDGLSGVLRSCISPDGEYLYAAGGSEDAIAVFSINQTTGALTFVENVSDGVNGVDGLDYVRLTVISPDGRFLYAAGSTDDAIAVFDRDLTTGELTYVTVYKDGVNGVDGLDEIVDLTISPDGSHVYSAGRYDNAISVFSRNTANGELSFIEVHKDGINGVDGLDEAYGVILSLDGKFVYSIGAVDDAVTVFNRNSTTGELNYKNTLKNGIDGDLGLDGPKQIIISPDNKHIYICTQVSNTISLFSRDRSSGSLSFVEYYKDDTLGIDGLEASNGLMISPDGKYIYGAGTVDDAISIFSRNTDTGVLSYSGIVQDGINGVDGLDGVYDVSISPYNDFLYSTGLNDNAVTVFSIDQFTSSLTTNPDSLDFDTTNVGNSDTLSFSIKNIGATNIFVTSTVTPTGFEIDPTNFALDEGDSSDVTVIFTPPDSGIYADSIYFYSNDSLSNALSYYVTGYGFQRPYISVSPTSINFDTTMVGFSSFKFVSIKNTGNDSLTVYSISSSQDVVTMPDLADSTVIPPFDSLSVKLKYSPDSLANFGGTLIVTSSDPDDPVIVLGYECLAKAADHAIFAFADTTLTNLDFDSVSLGSSSQISVIITNDGTTFLDIYEITAPNCFSTDSISFDNIAPGDSATFNVTFEPDTLGLYSDSLSIVSNDPADSLAKIGLTGFSSGPFITSGAVQFSFDSTSAFSSDTITIYIRNTGNVNLNITSASIADPFSITPSSHSGIAPGDSAAFTVIFAPDSLGTMVDSISFSSNDYQAPLYRVTVQGIGIQLVQTIITDPLSIDFGTLKINRTDSTSVTITNKGDSTFTIDSVYVPDQFGVDVSVPISITSGSSEEITVRYCPTDTGSHSGRITLYSFGSDTNYIFIDVSGYGSTASEPVIFVNPRSLDFGEVTAYDSTSLYLTTKNTGNEILQISSVTSASGEFSFEVYAISISPGDSFRISIMFQPSDSGLFTDTLSVNSDDPDNPVSKVILTGTGLQDTSAPEILVSPEIIYRDTNSVILSFRTDEYTANSVYYNIDSLYDAGTYIEVDDTALVRLHAVSLTGLNSGTKYKYHVRIYDRWQNGPTESIAYEFVTLDVPDTTPPVILGKPVAQEIDTGSVMFTWLTDEFSNSKVQLVLKGLGNDTLVYTDESTVYEHYLTVTSLEKDTVYYFRVGSVDQSGNGPTFSEPDSLRTTAVADITTPKIVYGPVIIGLNHHSAVIKIKTNENTTTSVNYDTSKSLVNSASDNKTKKTHTIRLTGLSASTQYHFNIEYSDPSGNTSTYPPGDIINLTFTTKPAQAVPDTTPPKIIEGPVEQNVNSTRFAVYWKTNVLADAAVEYGLDSELDKYISTIDTDLEHKLILTNLLPDTTYYYRVKSRGENNGETISSVFEVNTPAEPDTFAPVIIEGPIAGFTGDDNAVIKWRTNKTSSSRVDFGPDSLDLTSYMISDDISGVIEHKIQLADLLSDTVYYYTVSSISGNARTVTGSIRSFRTLAAADTIAPRIIQGPDPVSITENSATIEWITDEPSTSVIEYGLRTISAKNYTGSYWVDTDASGNIIHRAVLTGLESASRYDFRVESRDLSTNLNTSYSRNKMFTTAAAADTLPPVIIKGPDVYWTNTSVSIEWETDEICEMYVLLRQKNSGKKFMKYGWRQRVRKHTFTITNLIAGNEYEFELVSRDLNGNMTTWPTQTNTNSLAKFSELRKTMQPPGGDGSFFTNEKPDIQNPVIIEGPTVVSKSSNSVTVRWKTDERSDSYVVYGTDESYGSEKSDASDVTDHSITLTNLSSATVYNFKVRSTDPSGNGPAVSSNSAVLTEAEDDESPPLISEGPAAESITDDQATIVWETDEPADSQVDLGTTEDLGTSRISTEDVTVHNIVLTNLSAGTTYYYRIRSSDIEDNGPTSSSILSFTTAAGPDETPPVISSVTVSAVSDKTAVVSFNTDELSDTFVNYGLDTSYGNSAANSTDVTGHSITLTNLITDTLYYYKVGSIDKSGNESEFTNSLTFRTDTSADNSAPAQPQNLSGMQGSNKNVIWWDRNSEEDIGGYNLYRKTGAGSFQMIASMATDTFYFDRGLENTLLYWYKITAVDRVVPYNESDDSELFGLNPLTMFNIETPTPSYPSEGQRIRHDEAVLQVGNSDLPHLRETVTYEFVIAEEADFYDQIASVVDLAEGDPVTEWDPGLTLEHDRTYYWKARAYDGFFHSAWTSGMSFIADSTVATGVSEERPDAVGIPEIFELDQNYPNPFNPVTTIRFGLPKPGRVVIKIYNILGQEVKTLINEDRFAGYHRVKWNSTNNSGIRVAGGLYIYRIIFDGRSVSKKMVVIK